MRLKAVLLAATGLHLAVLHAEPIDMSILNPNRIGAPGSVEVFQGNIANHTGAELRSTDLFLNFSGFDPVNVALDQLIGLTDFSVPDGSASGIVDLFTFALAGTAAVPATYPAEVVLSTARDDVTDPQTVTLTTVVPEPSSLALTAVVLAALFWRIRRRRTIAFLVMAALVSAITPPADAQVSGVRFLAEPPGVAVDGDALLVAIPLQNTGTLTAANVQVTGVSLRTALLASPSAFPVSLGAIAPGRDAVFQANFRAAGLLRNTPYLLTVRGTYQVSGAPAGFAVNRFILIPPASPGSAVAQTKPLQSKSATGPFPHRPLGEPDNDKAPPIPIGPLVPGTPTPFSTSVQRLGAVSPGIRSAAPLNTVVFDANASAGPLGLVGVPAEPTGGSGGGVVVQLWCRFVHQWWGVYRIGSDHDLPE
jgi:hypothetical protein